MNITDFKNLAKKYGLYIAHHSGVKYDFGNYEFICTAEYSKNSPKSLMGWLQHCYCDEEVCLVFDGKGIKTTNLADVEKTLVAEMKRRKQEYIELRKEKINKDFK